eukprot:gene20230-39919_t
MSTARLCPLADVAALIPADCWMAERLAEDPTALADETVLWITGNVQWPELHLDAPLASGSPQRRWWHSLQTGADNTPIPRSLFLILVDGHLRIDGALTCDDTDGATHLIVTGDAQVHNAVIGGQLVHVQGTLRVQDLLWGHYNHGELRVHGGLQARVALFTGFPWGQGGYAQLDGPFADLAKMVGVHGLTFAAALLAAGVAGQIARPSRLGAS